MATGPRDVNFRLRAQDLTSRTMAEVTSASDKLTGSIAKLTEEAKKGEVSTGLLNEVLRDMKAAQDQLTRQSGLIQQFKDQSTRVAELTTKLDAARVAEQAYRAQLSATGTEVDESDRRLTKLGSSVSGAEKKLVQATGTLEKVGLDLERVGIDTKNLDAAQTHITATFDSSVIAANKLDGALTNYQRNLRETKAATEALGSGIDPAAVAAANAEEAKRESRLTLQFWNDVLDKREAKEREASAASKAAADAYVAWWGRALDTVDAKSREDAAFDAERKQAKQNVDESTARNYVKFWSQALDAVDAKRAEDAANDKALTAFRSKADDAQRAIGALASSETQAAAATGTLASAIASITDPTAKLRGTIIGTTDEIDRLATVVGTLKGATANYAGTAAELAGAQRSLGQQAALIDSFRRQEQQTIASTAALAAARVEYDEHVRKVRNAASEDKELAAGLEYTKNQVVQITAAVQEDNAALSGLSVRLRDAGIDVRQLATAEDALRVAAVKAAAAQKQLSTITSGRGGRGVQGLFGLKPYELQNLGFQINDVFTQIASGTSVMQTLAQQGGQIAQIFPGAFTAIAALAPQLLVIGGSVAAIGLALARVKDNEAVTREFAGALAASADGARYSVTQLTEARRAIDVYGASAADATKAVRVFIDAGIPQAKIEAFGKSAKDASDVLGIEFVDAAKQTATAFSKGYKEIADFDDKLNFLTLSERENIRAMSDSGDVISAREEAFRLFSQRMDAGATQARGPWSDAFRSVGQAWSDTLDWLGTTAPVVELSNLLDTLAGKLKTIAETISGMSKGGTLFDGWVNLISNLLPGGGAAAAGRVIDNTGAPNTPADQLKQLQDQRNALVSQRGSASPIPSSAADIRKSLGLDADTLGVSSIIPDRAAQDAIDHQVDAAKELRDIDAEIAKIDVQIAGKRTEMLAAQKDSTITAEQYATLQKQTADLETQKAAATERSLKIGSDLFKQAQRTHDEQKGISDEKRIQGKYDEALKTALDKGADRTSAESIAALAMDTERNKVAKENKAAADAAARAAEAEANKRTAAAQRLINLERELAGANRKGDTKLAGLGVDDLPTKLAGIDQQFDDIIAKAKQFQSMGGTQVRGQSVDAFIDDTNKQREQVKQLETVQHYQDRANDTLKQRSALVETYNNLVELGLMTETEAQVKIQAAYAETNPAIQQSIADATAMLQVLKDNGTITAAVFDEAIAKLKLLQSQLTYVSPTLVKIREGVKDAIEGGITTFFQGAAKALAGLIDGTLTWKDALESIGTTIVQVAAQFLMDIGMMILKLEALKIAQELTGMSGDAKGGAGGSGGGGIVGFITSVIGSLFHGGGTVGSGASRTTRAVSPLAFAGAPRYHEGVRNLGLKNDERTAILQTGETVLARGEVNPGFAAMGGPKEMNIRSLLYDDPARLHEAMASPNGEKVIQATVIKMIPTIKQQIR